MAMDEDCSAPFSHAGIEPASNPAPPWYPIARNQEFLTIGEMVSRFGVTPRALRFYEGRGLLSPQRRGAMRLYGPADCERLALVLKAKRLGFTLGEIRDMVTAPTEPGESGALSLTRRQCFEQIKLLEHRKREIEAALAELRRTYSSFYARMAGGDCLPRL